MLPEHGELRREGNAGGPLRRARSYLLGLCLFHGTYQPRDLLRSTEGAFWHIYQECTANSKPRVGPGEEVAKIAPLLKLLRRGVRWGMPSQGTRCSVPGGSG